jgi:hypothetical protein
MGLGGILQELKTEGVLALYHDYRSGRLVDYSGNARNGVATNTTFNKTGAIQKPATGAVTVTYDVGLVSTSISMLIGIQFPQNLVEERIASRRGAASTFDWYLNGANISVFQNGAVKSLVLGNFSRAIGISMSVGVAFKGYMDGVYSGDYSGVTDLVASNADLIIGNYGATQCLTHKIVGYFFMLQDHLQPQSTQDSTVTSRI